MTPHLRLPDPPLTGDGFVLRPWQPADAPAVAEACRDADTQRFITFLPRPYALEHASAFIAEATDAFRSGTALALAIAHPVTSQAIGAVTLHTGEPEEWGIGYWVAPPWRNRGIATQAVTELTRWAFSEYPALRRQRLEVLADNTASRRVAEAAGFRRDGWLRPYSRRDGTPGTIIGYALPREALRG